MYFFKHAHIHVYICLHHDDSAMIQLCRWRYTHIQLADNTASMLKEATSGGNLLQ